jgi:hypothetical protein
MAGAIPSEILTACPRCKVLRLFVDVSGGGTAYRCGGCEWTFTLSTTAPTGTSNASRNAGDTTISVASGGASFTSGMYLLYDTGTSTEALVVNGTPTATSIPVAGQQAGQSQGGFAKAHGSGVTFGQLALISTYGATGEEAVPVAPSWGF